MRPETKHLTGRLDKHQVEELERISRKEKIDRSSALRKVLDIGIREYLKRKAVEEYRKGEVSIGRAAEEAGLSISEFYNVLETEGVPIRIDSKSLKSALKSDFFEQ